ncbi:hypothetical protein D3C76_1054650 [compost metagenome]
MLAELAVERGGAALDLEPAGHDAFLAAAGLHAVLHHLPDLHQAVAGFLRAAPGLLVLAHQVADGESAGAAMGEHVLGGLETIGQRRAVLDYAIQPGGFLVHHEAAAHRVVLAGTDLDAGVVEGAEDHAVGMVGERFPDHRQVFLLDEADRLFAEQIERTTGANACQARIHSAGIHQVRVLALQPQQHGLVAAVALAGGAEGAVELRLHARHPAQQSVRLQPKDEARGGAHRSHGVGAGGADAHLEQIENA